MCVKYAQGSCIEEGDLDLSLFERLLPSLGHAKFLVLNGIGEPLLHPHLETMIAQARKVMPADGVIGFQSNGLLFDESRAKRLQEAGLDTVCLSLDSLEQVLGAEHQRLPVERAIEYLQRTTHGTTRPLDIGLEVVLKRTTAHQLPQIIRWAHNQGVGYIIASHLFSYDGTMEEESLFTPCSAEATSLFAKWSQKAQSLGLNLAELPSMYLKFCKSEQDQQLQSLGTAMQQEAREKDITLHFSQPPQTGGHEKTDFEACWQQALDLAQRLGIRLTLPPLQAPANGARSCPFMDEAAVFITTKGEVMPCHFLWHTYACMVNQETIRVHARPFGNITQYPLEQIWQDSGMLHFAPRRPVAIMPLLELLIRALPDLVTPNMLDIHDCYGTRVPCGHCMWSLGWTRCL